MPSAASQAYESSCRSCLGCEAQVVVVEPGEQLDFVGHRRGEASQEIADLGVGPPVGGNRVDHFEQRQRQRVAGRLVRGQGIGLVSAVEDGDQGAGERALRRAGRRSSREC